MERINIDTLPETNVDWYADGERANALVLNRPIKQVAGIVNTLIDAVNDQSANGEWTEQRVQQTVAAWWAAEGEALVAEASEDLGIPNAADIAALMTTLGTKQDILENGTNIKTVNGESILGSGDLVVGGGAALLGDTALHPAQTKTYTITNYNSFSTYTVSASDGTASLSGDMITFTAPDSAGKVSLTLTVDGRPTVFTVTVHPDGVGTPTIISPADGATVGTDSPVLKSSAFVVYGILTDTHLASRWTLYQDGTQVHDSGWRTDALTSYTVPAGVLTVSSAYTWTVEHRGARLGDSPIAAAGFTTATSFNTYMPTPVPTPTNFGDPLEGGFYAGMIWNELVQSATSTTIGTGVKTFTVPDMRSAPIVYAGQQLEVRSRGNPNNKFVGTVTGALGTNLTINVTSIGGSGTFSDWSVMARYRVIVAPKASGEHAGIALKNSLSWLPSACQSLTEGLRATQAMRDAGSSTVYPAAHWARNLNIGGRTDWYIPARDELELCWRNLKPVIDNNASGLGRGQGAGGNGSYGDPHPAYNYHGINNNSAPVGAGYTERVPFQTIVPAFRAGGAEAYEFGTPNYWSSSEADETRAVFQGWKSSSPGGQYFEYKVNPNRVRAIRRSII